MDLSQSITIIANLGVIVGIIFLAVEVGQNQSALEEANVLSRVSVETNAFQRFSDLRQQLIADGSFAEIVAKNDRGEILTQAEELRYRNWIVENLWAQLLLYNQMMAIGDSPRARNAVANTRRMVTTNPKASEVWQRQSGLLRDAAYPGFVEAVENAPAQE